MKATISILKGTFNFFCTQITYSIIKLKPHIFNFRIR